MKIISIGITLLLCQAVTTFAGEQTPAALARTNAENYKDRALALCLAQAYQGTAPGKDAQETMSIFLEFTYFDMEKANPALDKLIAQYLRRDYSNPVEGYAGAKFNLLKCIDMRHSRALQEQVKKFVPHPDWIGDKPPKSGKK